MPNNTITMDSSVSGLSWISFTQLSSGLLQDQCVYSWSGILHHFMAPSTGYQLCEPPSEPQSTLTRNRRKGKGKGSIKEILISLYWFLPNYSTMPYGVCMMVLDLEKANRVKGRRWERRHMGDGHINKATGEKWSSLGDTKIRRRDINPSTGLGLQPPIPAPQAHTPRQRPSSVLTYPLWLCAPTMFPGQKYVPYRLLAQGIKFHCKTAIPISVFLKFFFSRCSYTVSPPDLWVSQHRFNQTHFDLRLVESVDTEPADTES